MSAGTAVILDTTTKHARVEIRAGPTNCIEASIDLAIAGHFDESKESFSRCFGDATVIWRVKRRAVVNGKYEQIDDYMLPIEVHVDELEALATALYKTFHLAKSRGYLPTGGTDGGREMREAREVWEAEQRPASYVKRKSRIHIEESGVRVYIFRRGEYYYLSVRPEGSPRWKSVATHTTDRAVAEINARDLAREIANLARGKS